MIKFFLLMILLVFCMQLNAQEIVANTSDGSTSIYILVPLSQYIFSAQSPTTHYQLSLNLIDSTPKNVHQDIYDIVINKDWLIEDAAQVFSLELNLAPGSYKLVTLLRNLNLGDKKEKQFVLNIPEQGISEITNLVIAQNDNLRFSPAAYSHLSADLKSCFFILDTAVECDSIVLQVQYPESVRMEIIPRYSGTKYDIKPLLQEGKINGLEVRYYTDNIMDTRNWLLYQSYDIYNQQYTLKDQVQQLRYIANQNEWKTIKKLAEKDMESAIEYFWEKHDNSPGSMKNDLRELFYERVLKADEMFTVHKNIRGWSSDRGRIYIKTGPPDEIVSDPFPLGKPPYIIWYYYRQNLVYRFEDKRGFGDYKLAEGFYEN